MHKRILVLLALVLLLSGVGVAAAQTATFTPTPEGQWCYHFDFAQGDQDFEIQGGQGEYVAGGFRTTPSEWGALQVAFTHTYTVFPSSVDLIIEKGPFTTGSVDLALEGEFFGLLQDPLYYTMSPDFDQLQISISPESASDFDNTLTFFMSASAELYLKDIFVFGFGISPFPTDNCGAPTPTPVATSTATATHDPSACLLPGQATPTPGGGGPTATATPAWYQWLDTDGVDDWMVIDAGQIDAAYGNPAPSVAAVYEGSWSGTVYGAFVTVIFPQPISLRHAWFYYRHGAAYSGGARYLWVRNAAGTTLYSNNQNGVSTTWTGWGWNWDNQSGAIQNVKSVTFGVEGWGGSGVKEIWLDNFDIQYQWTTPGSYDPTGTPWPECTLTPTMTPSISPTPTNTPTPFTLTPTFTRTPTRTPFPIIIPTQPPTPTPRTPTPLPGPTNTLDPSITPTIGPGYNEGTVGPFVPPESGNGGQGTGMTGLGNALIALGSNAWQRATGWVSNAAGTITRFTDAWGNAAPTALPYMPQCRSNPLANELCAIWYILTFTVFSGTLGSLIVPMGVAVVDIYFLFVFIRLARAIIAQIKQMRS